MSPRAVAATEPTGRRAPALQLELLTVPREVDDELDAACTRAFFTMAGRCSGIPECCIAYFVAVMVDGSRRWPDEADPVAAERRGYRRCPACRAAGTLVVLRDCPMRPCGCALLKDLAFLRPRHTRAAWLLVAGQQLIGSAS